MDSSPSCLSFCTGPRPLETRSLLQPSDKQMLNREEEGKDREKRRSKLEEQFRQIWGWEREKAAKDYYIADTWKCSCRVERLMWCAGLCMPLCQIDCGCLMEAGAAGETHRVHLTARISGKSDAEVNVWTLRARTCEGDDAVRWFVLFPRWLVSITPNHRQRSLFPCDPTSFHFSISLSSAAAACFFIFLFPANDRKRTKCEIRKSVCK